MYQQTQPVPYAPRHSQQHLSQQRIPSSHTMDSSPQTARPVSARRTTQHESATSGDEGRPKSKSKRKHKHKDKDRGESSSGTKKKKKKSKAKKQEPEPVVGTPRPPRRSMWSFWTRYLCGSRRRNSTLNVELNELSSPPLVSSCQYCSFSFSS